MANDKEIALYYPYIDIDDASLIKTAALYWDEMQTIVPQDINAPYRSQAALEAEQEGFLRRRDVMWDDEAVEKAGNEFVDDVKTISEIRDIIARQPNLHPHRSIIYDGKISHLCKDELLRYFRGNIEREKKAYVMPAILANAYMTRLASAITSNDGSVPITDSPEGHDILTSRFVDYSQEHRSNQAQLATLSLQTLSINPETPLIEILSFKDKNRDMLYRFRSYMRELARQVRHGLDTNEKQNVFEELIRDKVIPIKGEIEAKLTENNLRFFGACLVTTLAGCVGVVISQEWLGELASTGIVAGAALFGNLRSERLIPADHPLAYLYKAQQQLGGES